MTFKELRPLMVAEERCIFRIYSSGDKIIDSGAVVIMNLGDQLDEAEVKLVYVTECIQHVDLLVSDDMFENSDWEKVFGKEVFEEKSPEFGSSF